MKPSRSWDALDAAERASLAVEMAPVTLVVISERVSAVRAADRILLLQEGRIDAQGSHEELLETSGRYRRMVDLQMGGGAG